MQWQDRLMRMDKFKIPETSDVDRKRWHYNMSSCFHWVCQSCFSSLLQIQRGEHFSERVVGKDWNENANVIVVSATYLSFSCMLKKQKELRHSTRSDQTDGVLSDLMTFESNKVRSSESSSFKLVKMNLICVSLKVLIDPHPSIGKLKWRFNIFHPSIF